jgi:hypothetical protein
MTMKDRRLVRSYSTDFPRAERPISEGGMWLNGKRDGIGWSDVNTRRGLVYGALSRMENAEFRAEQGNAVKTGAEAAGDYDDPTAVLSGEWGSDQHGRGVVHSVDPTAEYFQEVQIRLRSAIEPNNCTGYEIFFRCLKSEAGYAEIVRWNGPIGDWTSLERHEGADYGVEHGDVIEATIEGDLIRGFINGREVISARDDVFGEGAPGVGFNFGVGDTGPDHGFSAFEVHTYVAE